MKPRNLIAFAIALFGGPILADLIVEGRRRPFTYFASDAYYYLTIGWNSAYLGKLSSYDQTHASNGYHPAWQLLVTVLFALGRLLHLPELGELYLILVADAALVGVAIWLLGRALERDGRLSPLFALLPIGVYGIIALPYLIRLAGQNMGLGFPYFGSLWLDVDGMESGISVFAFALCAWIWVARFDRPILLGAALALLGLARLDHLFFSGMILVGVALRDLVRAPRKPRHFLTVFATFVGPVAVYLLLNRIFIGSALPVSGMLKSTFPHPTMANWGRLVGTMKSFLAASPWRMYRLAQMLIPVPFALVPPIRWLFGKRDPFDQLLVLCTPAVLALAGYDFFFVDLTSHGHWYFPVSTLYPSLVVLRLVGERPVSPLIARITVAVSAIVCIVAFVKLNHRTNYGTPYADFYLDTAPKVREFYALKGGDPPQIVEMDDGIIAFSTHFPCMSGSGLNLDLPALRAYQRHNLFPLARKRGFTRLSTVAYHNVPIRPDSTSEQIWSNFASGILNGADRNLRYSIEFSAGDFFIARADDR